MTGELENSLKLVETINMQKRELETENDELKQRLNEMVNERSATMVNVMDTVNSGGQTG